MGSKFANIDEEYKKDKNLTRPDVEAVLKWLEKQQHLPKITELQVTFFLKSSSYRIEAAKLALDNYFTARTHCPHIFDCLAEDAIQEILSVGFLRILPRQTPEGYNIVLGRLLDYRPKKFNAISFMKLVIMIITVQMLKNGAGNGLVIVADFQGVSFGHLSHVTPENLIAAKQFAYLVQDGAAVRIRGIHCINLVPYAETILSVVKQFMKNEFIHLIKLHSNSIETLFDYIPKKCLPEDYQGELPSIQVLQEENTRIILDNLDIIKWHDAQKVDEAKRSEKPIDLNSIFGIDGSFKKLEID